MIRKAHFAVMKDGAIVCNAGHFNVELDLDALADLSQGRRPVRDNLEEYRLRDGRRIYLLAEGRLVNLAAAEGHPSSVMDMSFANQTLCAEHLVRHAGRLTPEVHPVPREIDYGIAQLKLSAMGVSIDALTEAQSDYLNGWEMGT